MQRILFLALATMVATPALAGGDPVGREDLHHDQEASENTRVQQPRDRSVDREDLRYEGDEAQARKADLERETEVRLENGRYVLTEDYEGAKVEVSHEEKAIDAAAEEVKWDVREVADDLNQSAKDIVREAKSTLHEAGEDIDKAIH